MSFSGLKTALRRARDELVTAQGGLTAQDVADLSAGFQAAVCDVIVEKSKRAMDLFLTAHTPANPVLAVAGGVAANQTIRQGLLDLCNAYDATFIAPPLQYCTDNAAMIAWAGLEAYRAGQRDGLDLAARPRWPLDQHSPPMLGSGRKGAKA